MILKIGFLGVHSQNYFAKEYQVYEQSVEYLTMLQSELGFSLITYPLVEDVNGSKNARNFFEAQEIDFLLVQNSGFSMGDVLMELDGTSFPLGFWAIEEPTNTGDIKLHSIVSLNMYTSIANHCFKNGGKTKWFYGAANTTFFYNRLKPTVLALRAKKALKNTKIGFLGDIAPTFYNLKDDPDIYKGLYGVTVEQLSMQVLCDKISRLTELQIEHARIQIVSSSGTVSVSNKALNSGAKAYAALQLLARERGYSAIASSCWPDFQTILGIVPCVPFTLLSDIDNIPVACEGDVGAAMTMLVMKELSGKEPVLMDFAQISEEKNSFLLWHCGIGSKALAPGKDQICIINHPMLNRKSGEGESNGIGLSYDYRFADMSVVVARLSDNGRKLFCISGSTESNLGDGFSGTRGWVGNLHCEDKPISVLDAINTTFLHGVEHHLVIAPGTFETSLSEFAYWCNIEKIAIETYKENM